MKKQRHLRSIDLRCLFVALCPGQCQPFASVDKHIHECAHDDSRKHVENRVLFNEHGGQDDGKCQYAGGYPDRLPAPKRLIVHHRDMCPDGIIHMDAGPQVCGRVRLPEGGHHGGENIVPGHCGEPQVMAVGEECGYDQENGHTRKQKSACPEIICLILKKEEDHNRRHIGKP